MSRNLFLLVTGVLVAGIITWWFGAQIETRLFALEIKTGRVEWSAQPGSTAARFGPLTASADRVLVGVMTPEPGYEKSWKLLAFETVSGQPVWEFHPDPAQFGRVEAEETIGQDLLVVADRVYTVIRVEDPQISGQLLTKVAVLDTTTGTLRQVIGPVWFDQAHSYLPIAVAGNRLLIISPENPANLALQALDLETGAPVWHTPLGYDADTFHPTPFGPAIVANDQTVFLAMSRSIRAFDLATGRQKFTVGDVQAGTINQIGLVGSNLYDCRSDHLTAFDAATGAEKWRYPRPFDQFSLCHFQADAKSVYPAYFFEDFGKTEHGGGWVMAVDATTGRERWRTRLFTAAYLFDAPTARQIPVITPDLVLAVGGAEGQPLLIALTKTDGREQWRFSGGREPVTDGSHIFVLDRRSPGWRRWLAW
jgi:outer membrane protein assembly factor BamB